MNFFDSEELKKNEEAFTIVDIRNTSEVNETKYLPMQYIFHCMNWESAPVRFR